MTEHLRVHIEYDKGFENYVDAVLDAIQPVTELEDVSGFNFFRQSYLEDYNRHIQIDLFVDEEKVQESKQKIEKVLEERGREFQWEENFVYAWYALNQKEEDLLLKARKQSAALTVETLEAYRNGELEHRPGDLVNRNYHLTANQNGMTYLDEFRFCVKRIFQLLAIQFTYKLGAGWIYDKTFVRKEKSTTYEE